MLGALGAVDAPSNRVVSPGPAFGSRHAIGTAKAIKQRQIASKVQNTINVISENIMMFQKPWTVAKLFKYRN